MDEVYLFHYMASEKVLEIGRSVSIGNFILITRFKRNKFDHVKIKENLILLFYL